MSQEGGVSIGPGHSGSKFRLQKYLGIGKIIFYCHSFPFLLGPLTYDNFGNWAVTLVRIIELHHLLEVVKVKVVQQTYTRTKTGSNLQLKI